VFSSVVLECIEKRTVKAKVFLKNLLKNALYNCIIFIERIIVYDYSINK